MSSDSADALLSPERTERGRDLLGKLRGGLGQVIFGQDELLDLTTIALASRGHLLLEGLPGLGKTELVKGLSSLLGLSFRRVQFTPDLLPSDITGGPVLQEQDGKREFVFQQGPLFANLVLADEINRASPKTQSALLEAMQERQVSVLGDRHVLPSPFFVFATQNPIELEGTYPLPEAQLDRFLFKVDVPSVGPDVLVTILENRRRGQVPELECVMSEEDLQEAFAIVDGVFLPKPVTQYIARLVAATHATNDDAPDMVRAFVRHGASPRAAIALGEASRACALLAGRPNVDFDDVKRVAAPAIGHRIVLDHAARLEGVTPAQIVEDLCGAIDPLQEALPEGLR